MRVLVTGSAGMLGRVLVPCLQQHGHVVNGVDRAELDITNYRDVIETVGDLGPELIIHGAAYTQVDLAESEPEQAYKVNAYGTENLAVACQKLDIPMLYISTDYVFDGLSDRPYQPWDQQNPSSVYGKSKLAGEKALQSLLSKCYITRTSWLYGPHGKNFVETMLQLGADRKQLNVVADQHGSPTSTATLSQIICELIETERWGIYHATDGGATTWCDFAREILAGQDVEVLPCETKDFPRPAPRPKYSVLDKTSLIDTIGRDVVPWQEALSSYLKLRTQLQPA